MKVVSEETTGWLLNEKNYKLTEYYLNIIIYLFLGYQLSYIMFEAVKR